MLSLTLVLKLASLILSEYSFLQQKSMEKTVTSMNILANLVKYSKGWLGIGLKKNLLCCYFELVDFL